MKYIDAEPRFIILFLVCVFIFAVLEGSMWVLLWKQAEKMWIDPVEIKYRESIRRHGEYLHQLRDNTGGGWFVNVDSAWQALPETTIYIKEGEVLYGDSLKLPTAMAINIVVVYDSVADYLPPLIH